MKTGYKCVAVFSASRGPFCLDDKETLAITEHAAQGDGDKWYYDVELEGSREIIRLFDVVRSVWRKDD